MALIAATAAGLALDRAVWSDAPFWLGGVPTNFREGIASAIFLSIPVAAVWTFTILALGLRHPRHRLRRLFRRPGMAACFAASSALLLGGILAICDMQRRSAFHADTVIVGYGLPIMGGSAVTAVWGLSLLGGQYRPASDWIDRLGRLAGFYWMTSLLAIGWMLTAGL